MKKPVEIAIATGVAVLLVATVLATPLAEKAQAAGRATYAYFVWDLWSNSTIRWQSFSFVLPKGQYGWSDAESQQLVVFSRVPGDTSVMTFRSGLVTDSVVTDVRQICANVKCSSLSEKETEIKGVKVYEAQYSSERDSQDIETVLKANSMKLVVKVVSPVHASPKTLALAKNLVAQAIDQQSSK